MTKRNDIKQLGRDEHEDREARRHKKQRLRGHAAHAKPDRKPRTIREQRAADKGQRAREAQSVDIAPPTDEADGDAL